MLAMVLKSTALLSDNPTPLERIEYPEPVPSHNEVVIRVSVCGVCHTEIDEAEGRSPPRKLPVIPGHQVVGYITALGDGVTFLKIGQRVGVAWIYSACGQCLPCKQDQENLCTEFQATGRDKNGGYAEYMKALAHYVHAIPDNFTDAQAAPLLCAGAVGYRALCQSNIQNSECLGLMGFGASAHLVLQMARHKFPETKIYVFARKKEERDFARSLGAFWTGDILEIPPTPLHAIIDTTPVWTPVVSALQNLKAGGRLVINALSKENVDKHILLKLDYTEHLWLEKEIKTIANVTRRDVREFLALASAMSLQPEIEEYKLEDANQALIDLKTKSIHGAKILRIWSGLAEE